MIHLDVPLFGAQINSRDTLILRKAIQLDPCSYCDGPGGTKDHIVPKVAGGLNESSNYTGACLLCNRRKGAKTLLGFLYQRRWEESGTLPLHG